MNLPAYEPLTAALALTCVTLSALATFNILTRLHAFSGVARAGMAAAGGLALGAGMWTAEVFGALALSAHAATPDALAALLTALGLDLAVGLVSAALIASARGPAPHTVALAALLLGLGSVAARLVLLTAPDHPVMAVLPVALAVGVASAGAYAGVVLARGLEHLSPGRVALRRPIGAVLVMLAFALAHVLAASGLAPAPTASGMYAPPPQDLSPVALIVALALLGVMGAVQIASTVHSAAETRAYRALEDLRRSLARLDAEVGQHRAARDALNSANHALREHVRLNRRMLTDSRALGELAQALLGCLSEDEVARTLHARMPHVLPGTAGRLLRAVPGGGNYRALGGWSQPAGTEGFARPDCLALRHGHARRYWAAPSEPRCRHLHGVGGGALCAPLTSMGEEIGLLVVEHPVDADADFAARFESLAGGVADRVALALANVRLRAQSIRDPLTGLYNRRVLEETLTRELARAQRDGSGVAVVLVDIDHFKAYNDRYGHEAGDRVIRAVAGTLLGQVRSSDIVCRYGGEEFLILLTDVRLHEAVRRARQVCESMHALLVADPRLQRRITVSAGVAGYPDHGDGADTLVRAADLALYAAKAAGRDRAVLAGAHHPDGTPTTSAQEET